MSFTMDCPHCKRSLNVTEKAAGKTVPCPGCGQPVAVPQGAPPPCTVRGAQPVVPPLPLAQATPVAPPPPVRTATPPIPSAMHAIRDPDAQLNLLSNASDVSPRAGSRHSGRKRPSRALWIVLGLILGALAVCGALLIVAIVERVNGRVVTDSVTAQARREIESKLLHIEDSWYGYDLSYPYDLVQMKGLSIETAAYDLDAADKANGIEWRGVVRIQSEIYRTLRVTIDRESKAVRVVGKWGEWRTGTPVVGRRGIVRNQVPIFARSSSGNLELTIRNGKWEWSVPNAERPDRAIIP